MVDGLVGGGGGAGFDTRAGQAQRETFRLDFGQFLESPELPPGQPIRIGIRTGQEEIGGHHNGERRAGPLAQRGRHAQIAADHFSRSPAEFLASRGAGHAAGVAPASAIPLNAALLDELGPTLSMLSHSAEPNVLRRSSRPSRSTAGQGLAVHQPCTSRVHAPVPGLPRIAKTGPAAVVL